MNITRSDYSLCVSSVPCSTVYFTLPSLYTSVSCQTKSRMSRTSHRMLSASPKGSESALVKPESVGLAPDTM